MPHVDVACVVAAEGSARSRGGARGGGARGGVGGGSGGAGGNRLGGGVAAQRSSVQVKVRGAELLSVVSIVRQGRMKHRSRVRFKPRILNGISMPSLFESFKVQCWSFV